MVEIRATIKKTYRSTPRFSAGVMKLARGEAVEPTHCRPDGAFKEERFKAFGQIREGDQMVLRGEWVDDANYGHQFQVKSYEHDRPSDEVGLARFLADHPDMSGIGDVRARRIVAEFGAADFSRALIEETRRVAEAAGVPLSQMEKIREAWIRGREENEDRIKLAVYNLTASQQNKLYEVYRNADNVIKALHERPYELIERVVGFGFKTVDLIARRLGRALDDSERLRAGVVVCVEKQLDRGHCWTHRGEIVEEAVKLLEITDREKIVAAIESLVDDGKMMSQEIDGREAIAGREIYEQECDIADIFAKRAGLRNSHLSGVNVEDLISSELNAAQRAAVLASASENTVLITGGAGVGKTFTIQSIVKVYEKYRKRIALVAPTGKAAKRIEQVVGRPASTIHRFLGPDRDEQPCKFDFAYLTDPEADIARLAPEIADVVIVDEVSMVDVPLMWRLLQRLGERTAIVLVGDPNQLPSVGPGSVLRDLAQRQIIHHVVLDEVVRQAGALKECSIAILGGDVRETVAREPFSETPWFVVDVSDDEALAMVDTFWNDILPNDFGLDVLRDVQLLAPTKKGPLGTKALNNKLQVLVQRSLGVDVQPPILIDDVGDDDEDDEKGRGRLVLYPRDRVIHTKNNYYLGVMNGEIGEVVEVDRSNGNVAVSYDDDRVVVYDNSNFSQLALAYALTVHKYQGSQVRCAVVLMSRSMMNTKNLLYTAVTRAQKVVILIGQRSVLEEAAKKEEAMQRRTFLSIEVER